MHHLCLASALLGSQVLAATWTVTEVDSSPYTGGENAIYAPDASTVYIAYKQFLEPPGAGSTWTSTFVEPDFGGVNTAVKGFASGTVYAAYWTFPPSAKLAKSEDRGSTWARMPVPEPARSRFFSTWRYLKRAVLT